ncbi:MAG: hypothetical protein NTY07_14430 [Bacteroidia bacterium]|nr:hypothetical protein [Bacteroidia bacterium]
MRKTKLSLKRDCSIGYFRLKFGHYSFLEIDFFGSMTFGVGNLIIALSAAGN